MRRAGEALRTTAHASCTQHEHGESGVAWPRGGDFGGATATDDDRGGLEPSWRWPLAPGREGRPEGRIVGRGRSLVGQEA